MHTARFSDFVWFCPTLPPPCAYPHRKNPPDADPSCCQTTLDADPPSLRQNPGGTKHIGIHEFSFDDRGLLDKTQYWFRFDFSLTFQLL